MPQGIKLEWCDFIVSFTAILAYDFFKIIILFCVIFQINEDLAGEVNFLAQTGAFSIPIACTTKKCDVSNSN